MILQGNALDQSVTGYTTQDLELDNLVRNNQLVVCKMH